MRRHPVTGARSLYLVMGQADWLEGPIVGLEPGPDGEGGRVLRELMTHATDPRFVYAHEWAAGDLVLYDNRCLMHAATCEPHLLLAQMISRCLAADHLTYLRMVC